LVPNKFFTKILFDDNKVTNGWIRFKNSVKDKINTQPGLALGILLEGCNLHLANIAKVDFEIFPVENGYHSRILLTINGKYYGNPNGVVAATVKRAKALSAKFCLFALLNKSLNETQFNWQF